MKPKVRYPESREETPNIPTAMICQNLVWVPGTAPVSFFVVSCKTVIAASTRCMDVGICFLLGGPYNKDCSMLIWVYIIGAIVFGGLYYWGPMIFWETTTSRA